MKCTFWSLFDSERATTFQIRTRGPIVPGPIYDAYSYAMQKMTDLHTLQMFIVAVVVVIIIIIIDTTTQTHPETDTIKHKRYTDIRNDRKNKHPKAMTERLAV